MLRQLSSFLLSFFVCTVVFAADKTPDVFVEASVTSAKPYVQSQVLYTVRVYYGVTIMKGSLTDPTADDAIIVRLSETQETPTRRGGRPYNIIERRYAILPQRSGDVSITPSVLTGEDPLKQPIRATANTVVLNVQPKPTDVKGTWLPAQMLSLQETWSSQKSWQLGEPVIRTLIVNAIGVSGEQLPDLAQTSSVNGLNSYPAQASVKTDAIHSAVTGQRIEKITLIANEAGEFTLPAVEVLWWNTQTKQPETALLPARKVTVLSSAKTQKKRVNSLPASQNTAQQKKTIFISQWMIIGVFLVTWGVLIFLWKKLIPKKTTWYSVKRTLKKACLKNNLFVAKKVFLQWAQFVWGIHAPQTLAACKEHAQSEFLKKELQIMDAILYSENSQKWNGKAFWAACEEEQKLQADKKKKMRKSKKEHTLPPLNPSR